jgi:hypothetical protein
MSAITVPAEPRTRPRHTKLGRSRLGRTKTGRRERRGERRRLKQQDALSAQLAELHAIRALLERATEVVGAGWVQGAWFTVATAEGTRAVTAYDLPVLGHRPVTGACLVGSVVEAAGGPATVRSQLVQRTLDLVWHTLREDPERPVRWCPGPRMRMLGLLELTSWNDAPQRTQEEVVGLLRAGQKTADVQRSLCRAERAALASR